MAEEQRKKRDPVEIELRKIVEKEAAKAAAQQAAEKVAEAKVKLLEAALQQWVTGMKSPGGTSIVAYRSTTRKILRWAKRVGVINVSDVTLAMLDEWRGSWSPQAELKDNRLALTTQAALLTRIKAFFKWATGMEFIPRNPALSLKAITPEESQTWPLTSTQFEELLAVTFRLDAEAQYESSRVGAHLRAIFLVQRWTGPRVGDVLTLPKSALQGNRLSALIRKKRKRKPSASRVECILPDHVEQALTSIPLRKEEHSDYFFWSRTCTEEVNVNKWLRKIDRLNNYLAFNDEDGRPMGFRSHMLRDTFAVEMLLVGTPLEKVSKLLTHESVKMTEQYYAKWTSSRKQQLEDEAVAAMRRMGVAVTMPV